MSLEQANNVFFGIYKLGAQLLINPKTGWGARIDNYNVFKFDPSEVTLLRILDSEEYLKVPEIAFQIETGPRLNEMMMAATSSNGIQKEHNSLASMLDKLDLLYGKDGRKSFVITDSVVRVRLQMLQEKIGYDLIENRHGFGYRLKHE